MMKSLMSALRTGALLRSARVASFAAAALAMSFGPGSEYAQASTVKVLHPRKQAQTVASTGGLPRKPAAAKSKR